MKGFRPYRTWGLLITSFILIFALLFISSAQVMARPLLQRTVSVYPDTGPPGTRVKVSGSGWTHNSQNPPYEIHWDNKGGPLLGTFSTDSNGDFTENITIPRDIVVIGERRIWVCEGCGSGSPQTEFWVAVSFNVTPWPTPIPTPTSTPIPTTCDVTGGPGEIVIDFEDFTVDENLRGVTLPEGVRFMGDSNLFTIQPTVETRSPSQALTIAQMMEFGSINIPVRIGFSNLQDFVGVFVGLNEQIWADAPITATLIAYGLDEAGHRIVAGTDSVSFGPEATPIKECLSVEAPRIFEITIDYGPMGEPEVLDDLIIRGPEEPVPVPEDDTPPVVTITAPEDGTTIIDSSVRLDGEVTEDRELARVEVWLNDALYDEIGFSPAGYSPEGDRRYLFALDAFSRSDLQACEENAIEVVAYDAAENSGSDEVAFEYIGSGDLEINSVEAVQVVYEPLTLIKNKGTAFRAKVKSTFACPMEVKFKLELPEGQWSTSPPTTGRYHTGVPPDWEYPEIWGPVTIPGGATDFEVMLPYIPQGQEDEGFSLSTNPAGMIRGSEAGGVIGPDVRVVPRTIADRVTFGVEIDPQNTVFETDETNNSESSYSYYVVTTREWKVLFISYLLENCAPGIGSFDPAASVEYLLANFPIADSKISYAFQPGTAAPCPDDPSQTCSWGLTWEEDEGRGHFLDRAARMALAGGYDLAVGIGCGGGGGAIGGFGGGVFIGEGVGQTVLAHEFNHATTGMGDIYALDCFVAWDAAYCEHPDGTREYCCQDDAWEVPDGYTNTNCALDAAGEIVCEEQTKGCALSCGCSIYRRDNPSGGDNPCQETDAAGEYVLDTCDAGCCRRACEAICDDGTVYTGPDGRTRHPASEGFWVNRWLETDESMNYFMDIGGGGPYPHYWMRLNSTGHHCHGTIFNDGWFNLLVSDRFLSDVDPEALLVSGTIDISGRVSFDPFVYLPQAALDIIPGQAGDYYFVLLDESGDVLSQSGFTVYFYYSDPDGGPVDETPFAYRIEWKEGTRSIELRDKQGNPLASREVSQNTPKVSLAYPNGGETWLKGRTYTVQWEASDDDDDLISYCLDISLDGGETWLPMAIDMTDNSYELDTGGFDEGDNYRFRVRATDGVNTGEDISDGAFSIRMEQVIPTTPVAIAGLVVLVIVGLGMIVAAVVLYRRRKVS